MKLTKDTLIEGKIYPKGTEYVVESTKKLEEGFIDTNFQSYVDSLHNNPKSVDFSGTFNIDSKSNVYFKGKGTMSMLNRSLVIDDNSNSDNSIWISNKDIKQFQIKDTLDDIYIKLNNDSTIRLRDIR